MPMEALKKEMNHLPWSDKKKGSELIHHFLHLVMIRKMWMSLLMIFLMILLMIINKIRMIQIKES